ncbi:MAG: hypothetical protein JWM11_1583 [Planctomycetaceae bacterium]|nr:hypothetical protein [Planctomycetaceae bacterium]
MRFLFDLVCRSVASALRKLTACVSQCDFFCVGLDRNDCSRFTDFIAMGSPVTGSSRQRRYRLRRFAPFLVQSAKTSALSRN